MRYVAGRGGIERSAWDPAFTKTSKRARALQRVGNNKNMGRNLKIEELQILDLTLVLVFFWIYSRPFGNVCSVGARRSHRLHRRL